MYYELSQFLGSIAKDRSTWKDGELWTAAVIGATASYWFDIDPEMIPNIRAHFGDLLSATSITAGFVLTALFFHLEAIASWRTDPEVQKVADRIITYHVWTVVSYLFQLGLIFVLWICDSSSHTLKHHWRSAAYGFLVFMALYCGFQILNDALWAWWVATKRGRLAKKEVTSESDPEGRTTAPSHIRPSM